MKKWLLMTSLVAGTVIAFGETVDITPFLGTSWYGLYFNGEKVGYMEKVVSRNDAGETEVVEDAHFRVSMSGAKQAMRMYSKRVYNAKGGLLRIEMEMNDPAQSSVFVAVVEGDTLKMNSVLGGATREDTFPRPGETLQDSLRHALWARRGPQVGDVVNFSTFEPMYQKEVSGISRIVKTEERVFNGVPTKVYEIQSVLDLMDIESTTYVTDSGITVEDVISGVFTTRLEPEDAAKDVDYSVDTMVSNAVLLEKPIDDPRERDGLHLLLTGPLRESHLFNDRRQTMTLENERIYFHSVKTDLAPLPVPGLPVTEESVQHYLKPGTYVQSDDPKLIEKARDIVGDETDALKAAGELCTWVNKNMRNVFSARLSNALEALESLEGDCTEHTVLFVGLARAIGLPAREVAGLIYVAGSPPGFYFHQWASVWLGDWIDVDPAFNQLPVDVTHIRLAEGDLFRQAKILPLIGRLGIEVLSEPPAPKAEQKTQPDAGELEHGQTAPMESKSETASP
ncbi:MAG: transglutaminase domain-containing protein [Candidatus Hydrogenedentes bacterium]|nr:transglutaminase domain-containing protein [Candidatus Hydrogenedentota bacterium]